jgi:hypothetical protein
VPNGIAGHGSAFFVVGGSPRRWVECAALKRIKPADDRAAPERQPSTQGGDGKDQNPAAGCLGHSWILFAEAWDVRCQLLL